MDKTYQVTGVDCPNCARELQEEISQIPGVEKALFSFSTEKLSVSGAFSEAKVKKQVESLGYQLQNEPAPQNEPIWSSATGRRFLISTVILLFGLIGALYSPLAPALAALIMVWPFAQKVWRSRRSNPFNMNLLLTLAVVGAVAIGESIEAMAVVFLFVLGELLEEFAAGQSRKSIRALLALAPKTALLLSGGSVQEVPVSQLQIGQKVLVRPGDRVPTDGVITSGISDLDQSPLTGESLPVTKAPGDTVLAGSVNLAAALEIEVSRLPQDSTAARIIKLVEEAEENKSPTARFIDRFARVYTPIVLLAAVLLVAVLPLFGLSFSEALYRGLALLLIGCPCALVLSTPAAVTAAIAAGAKRGLLFKGGAALEAIGKAKTVAFDKTGTLTQGRPEVKEVVALGGNRAEVLAKAAAVEATSNHPLAQAILAQAQAEGIAFPESTNGMTLPGQGAFAELAGQLHAVVAPRHAGELGTLPEELANRVQALEKSGHTAVVVLNYPNPLGVIALADQIRLEAKPALSELKELGLHSLLLTGDNQKAAARVASELGLEVRAELLPQDKLAIIEELKNKGPVVMVGDGINDAPALAAADVGIAIGKGSEIALEAADAALLTDSLTGVGAMFRLSRRTLAIISQNIALALGLKAIFLVGIIFGFTELWMAILADTGATAIVTANSLRLLGFIPKLDPEPAAA